MEKFRIATVQMNALRDDLEHNLAAHTKFSQEAANEGCRLIMFPELSVTAHFADEGSTDLAQEADSGRIFETMRDLAKEQGIVIGYGFCERAHGTFYNAYALMGGEGLIGLQRKVHASQDEYLHFRMGQSFEIFNLGFCRLGILVCFDASFFEAWRVMAIKGVEVLLIPHAGRSGQGEEVPAKEQKSQLEKILDGLPGRYGIYAEDNAVFANYGNQVGYNGHSTHSGGAYILGPDGKTIARSDPSLNDLWIQAELNPDLLETARSSRYSLLRTRRPEMYRELIEKI